MPLVLLALWAGGCSSSGRAVPRPFPGAPLPPVAEAPPVVTPPADPGTAPAPGGAAAGGPSAPGATGDGAVIPGPGGAPAVMPLLATALQFRGVPYRNGGSDPSGFDCSGFVQYVFRQHGLALPREVRDQFRAGTAIDRRDVRPGDLVFFQTVARGASHVGIALGDDTFVHAPSSRGVVRVERYTTSYWASRWVGARRVTAGIG